MIASLNELLKYWSIEIKNLKDYIDDKVNECKSYLNSAGSKIEEADNKYQHIINIVNDINGKITQDALNILDNFGSELDFDLGFGDGLNNNEYGSAYNNNNSSGG